MPRRVLVNPFEKIVGFDWNQANINKNLVKHNVSWQEAEEVFKNQPIITSPDKKHSLVEKRYQVLGKTNGGRKIFIALTIRAGQFRIISARDQDNKERRIYAEAEKAHAYSKI